MSPCLISPLICATTDPEHHRFIPWVYPPQEPGRRDHPAECIRGPTRSQQGGEARRRGGAEFYTRARLIFLWSGKFVLQGHSKKKMHPGNEKFVVVLNQKSNLLFNAHKNQSVNLKVMLNYFFTQICSFFRSYPLDWATLARHAKLIKAAADGGVVFAVETCDWYHEVSAIAVFALPNVQPRLDQEDLSLCGLFCLNCLPKL